MATTSRSKESRRKSLPKQPVAQPVDDARLAVGALLGFYRRIRRDSHTQAAVANAAGLTASALGMFEAGRRLPSPEAIDKLATVLSLDAFSASNSSSSAPTVARDQSLANNGLFLKTF